MDAIYGIGSNGSGQLGIGHKEDVSVPKPSIFFPDPPTSPIVKVAAGGNHTLLLTEAGKLYWSGDSTTGACGLGPATNLPAFQAPRLSNDGSEIGEVAFIAATWTASFVVSKDEAGKRTKMFSFGLGEKGELGLGQLWMQTPTATQFKDFPPQDTEIVDLAACMGHVVVVLSNGDAYGWGNCRKGQIGGPGEVVVSPRKVAGVDFKIRRAVCAKESTCFFGEPGSSNIKVLGSDKWGLISNAPSKADAWLDVGASWGNFYILNEQGALHGWGRNDFGQLPPTTLPVLQDMAVGSEHVVARAVTNNVITWGWGEHGNCGPSLDAGNMVSGRFNTIVSHLHVPSGSRVTSIGAGCATTWVGLTIRPAEEQAPLSS